MGATALLSDPMGEAEKMTTEPLVDDAGVVWFGPMLSLANDMYVLHKLSHLTALAPARQRGARRAVRGDADEKSGGPRASQKPKPARVSAMHR